MSEMKGKALHYSEIEAQETGGDAKDARIRWLIDREHDNAPVYALRMIELEAGGYSPHHQHNWEHENFVVEGTGELQIEDTVHRLYPGVVCFVPPNVMHQFRNTGQTPLKFLCGIPAGI